MRSEDTPAQLIEETFRRFTTAGNIGVLLINQKIAEGYLRPLINTFEDIFPTILEIPSKDAPYDLKKDAVAIKAAKLLWGNDSNLE